MSVSFSHFFCPVSFPSPSLEPNPSSSESVYFALEEKVCLHNSQLCLFLWLTLWGSSIHLLWAFHSCRQVQKDVASGAFCHNGPSVPPEWFPGHLWAMCQHCGHQLFFCLSTGRLSRGNHPHHISLWNLEGFRGRFFPPWVYTLMLQNKENTSTCFSSMLKICLFVLCMYEVFSWENKKHIFTTVIVLKVFIMKIIDWLIYFSSSLAHTDGSRGDLGRVWVEGGLLLLRFYRCQRRLLSFIVSFKSQRLF